MSTSRRDLLLGSGGSVLLAALAGCGHPATSQTAPPTAPTAAVPSGSATTVYPRDLGLIAVAAALDSLLVRAYDVALSGPDGTDGAGGKGQTGARGVAPFTAYLTAARSHHAAHAAAWTRQLTADGAPATGPDALPTAASLLAGVRQAVGTGDPAVTAARLLALERTAAATALAALGSERAAALAASIAPVEAQHVGVLSLLLGDPVAASAQLTATGALDPGGLS